MSSKITNFRARLSNNANDFDLIISEILELLQDNESAIEALREELKMQTENAISWQELYLSCIPSSPSKVTTVPYP